MNMGGIHGDKPYYTAFVHNYTAFGNSIWAKNIKQVQSLFQ